MARMRRLQVQGHAVSRDLLALIRSLDKELEGRAEVARYNSDAAIVRNRKEALGASNHRGAFGQRGNVKILPIEDDGMRLNKPLYVRSLAT